MEASTRTIGFSEDASDPGVPYSFTPEQVEALEATRRRFTPEALKEAELRQPEGAKLIDRLAAPETLEEQQRLADELVPAHEAWHRGRNRVRSVPARRRRVGALIVPRARARERRPAAARRTSSSSRTSSTDPGGEPDPHDEPGQRQLGFGGEVE